MKQMTTFGHLGQDASIQETNGKKTLRTTLAVYEGYINNQGRKVERTTWFTIFYRHTGIAPHLKKGSRILVQGEHSVNLYKDQNGQHQIGQTINADMIQFLDKKPTNETPQQPGSAQGTAVPQEDEMPF